MRVQRGAAGPDRLFCNACGLAFELEMEGARLHVSRWPDGLPFLLIMIPDEWRTTAELRSLVRQNISANDLAAPISPAASVQLPPPIPTAKTEIALEPPVPVGLASLTQAAPSKPTSALLDTDAIGIRIKQLRALGNSSKEISTTLTQAETDPERVKAILGILYRMERQEQTRQSKKLFWSLGILAALVILLVAAGYVLQIKTQNQAQANAAGPAGQKTPPPNPLAQLLKLNTPVVNYNAVAPPVADTTLTSGCPRTAQEAADLFGGQPADWYYPPGSHGWVLARTASSTNIFVPKGMKAAYLLLSDKLNLIEVQGPASLSGAYYAAISCP
jgi:hypothetical protein